MAREVKGDEPLDTSEGAGERMLREERAACIRAALASLSEEHRAILVLREMEGHDYDAIAEILELPVGTVRSRLHRARLQMRELLEQTMLGKAE
jgi:RNA polymerase sigma-70 factor (ECF subfamily)